MSKYTEKTNYEKTIPYYCYVKSKSFLHNYQDQNTCLRARQANMLTSYTLFWSISTFLHLRFWLWNTPKCFMNDIPMMKTVGWKRKSIVDVQKVFYLQDANITLLSQFNITHHSQFSKGTLSEMKLSRDILKCFELICQSSSQCNTKSKKVSFYSLSFSQIDMAY